MSEAAVPVSPLLPGPLASQGKAIAALLQEVFPASLFQFRFLPAKIDRAAWKDIQQGNQPFLGLGFVGAKPVGNGRVFEAVASWMLICAVRAGGSPKTRFYGDAQGIGALDVAAVAAAAVQGRIAATGTVTVSMLTNAMAEDWTDDTAIVPIELQIPFRFPLIDAVTKPQWLGLFEELAQTWNVPVAGGSQDIFTSDWENPNV